MRLLVSTPLQIFLVDIDSGKYSILRAGDGYYYGISHSNGVIALTHSSGYLRLCKSGNNPTYSSDHLIQPHQMEWIGNRVLVTNTGLNCISVYDDQGVFVRDVYLNDIRRDDKEKNRLGNHFNSVHKIGEYAYVVAHNYNRSSEVYQLNWPELQVVDIISSKASWAHNIWSSDLGLIICDSRNGSLYEIFSGETVWKADESESMTRGLAVAGDYIFIGTSLKAKRKDRKWMTGSIWIVDRKTLETVDILKMPGSGEIYDIRVIGSLDDCHNDQIIREEDIWSISWVSQIIATAHHVRRARPPLQRDWLPLSVTVRGVQMFVRFRNWMIRHSQPKRRTDMEI